MPSATASQKSASPTHPKKSSPMPAKFSPSSSLRRNLARSRRHDFPTSPVFSQLESCHGSNRVSASLCSSAQFNPTMCNRALRRQKAKPLDPNLQHSSLQLTSERCRVPSFNRLAAFPQNPRASHVSGVKRVESRIRLHVARIPGTFDRFCQSDDASAIRRLIHFHSPNFREYRTPLASILHWPKTTSLARYAPPLNGTGAQAQIRMPRN